MFWKQVEYLFSKDGIRDLLTHFLMAFGIIWLSIESLSYFFPDKLPRGLGLFLASVIIAVLWATIRSLPPRRYSRISKASNVEVEIKIGKLLDQPCNIAMGSSDYFDSAPDVISNETLRYKLIQKSFNGNHTLFDKAISTFLDEHHITGTLDPNKTFGKRIKFPIGTVVVIPDGSRKTFLTVFAKMYPDKTTIASKEAMWTGLCCLWTAVRQHGSLEPIALPLWGAGQARANASRLLLVQLILISFAMATRETKVSRKLSILVREEDYHPSEMMEVIKLLGTLEF